MNKYKRKKNDEYFILYKQSKPCKNNNKNEKKTVTSLFIYVYVNNGPFTKPVNKKFIIDILLMDFSIICLLNLSEDIITETLFFVLSNFN